MDIIHPARFFVALFLTLFDSFSRTSNRQNQSVRYAIIYMSVPTTHHFKSKCRREDVTKRMKRNAKYKTFLVVFFLKFNRTVPKHKKMWRISLFLLDEFLNYRRESTKLH